MPQAEIILEASERQPCEVWTRVMGYHRPVGAFNAGKKQEHRARLYFQESSPSVQAIAQESTQ